MNFLAHFFLSNYDESLIIGNFIADHIKGNKLSEHSDAIARGIRLHREIDQFTDQHPTVRKSTHRLHANYHKYSPVIVDMFYDHLLAFHWHHFSSVSLENFAKTIYEVLNRNMEFLPERSQHTLYYMEKQNWLLTYKSRDGIQRALSGLSRRTKFDSRMEESVLDLYDDFTLYQEEFLSFFPELIQHCEDWQKSH